MKARNSCCHRQKVNSEACVCYLMLCELVAITVVVKVGGGMGKVHHFCELLVYFLAINYLIGVCPEVLIYEFA